MMMVVTSGLLAFLVLEGEEDVLVERFGQSVWEKRLMIARDTPLG